MTKRIKIGVVGCGDVALHTYLPAVFLMSEKTDLVAVCDKNESRAKKAMKLFKAKEYYTDYFDMLKKADIDAIINITNFQFHGKSNIAALRAGKHVFTEKPMATTMEDADTMIEEARKANLKLACAPTRILEQAFKDEKEIIDKGVIGNVIFARAHSNFWGLENRTRWTDPTPFYTLPGALLFDSGVYLLTYLVSILGPAKRVVAFSGIGTPERVFLAERIVDLQEDKRIKITVDDTYMILLDFGGSTFAFVDAGACMKPGSQSQELGAGSEFFGTEGVLLTPPGNNSIGVNMVYTEKKIPGYTPETWLKPEASLAPRRRPAVEPGIGMSPPKAPFGMGIEHWVDCILEDRKPILSGELARHVLEIMLKVMESSKTGQVLKLKTTFNMETISTPDYRSVDITL